MEVRGDDRRDDRLETSETESAGKQDSLEHPSEIVTVLLDTAAVTRSLHYIYTGWIATYLLPYIGAYTNNTSILVVSLQYKLLAVSRRIDDLAPMSFDRKKCLDAANMLRDLLPELFDCSCPMKRPDTRERCDRIQWRLANNTCLGKFYIHSYKMSWHIAARAKRAACS